MFKEKYDFSFACLYKYHYISTFIFSSTVLFSLMLVCGNWQNNFHICYLSFKCGSLSLSLSLSLSCIVLSERQILLILTE